MLADHLPIYRLRLRTERLELRLPENFDEIAELADTAAAGVHDPGFMPFGIPWTADGPKTTARNVAIYYHHVIGRWDARAWTLPFYVFLEGRPIGVQDIKGVELDVTREVATGSWIGRAHQGKGIGKEMRAAVLHFAFAELGADYATSSSYDANAASAGVSRSLGYRDDGIRLPVVQGVRRTELRWRLSRDDWEAHRKHEVVVEGLDDDVKDMLGLTKETS
ncbi:GNAT family protein [Glycomyces luteolus]|uniref:GNAT family protein n=1 Tax=Glycomyces luteolus TaxID=2670330 RepID=A0A9X3P7P8_9ACTN|nr:GNAT family protein [Glycomyces luteolus]MDA1358290.1 GNAT family protein [Glycomyces luteolus]